MADRKYIRYTIPPLAALMTVSLAAGPSDHDDAVIPHHPETHQDPYEPMNLNGRAAIEWVSSGQMTNQFDLEHGRFPSDWDREI